MNDWKDIGYQAFGDYYETDSERAFEHAWQDRHTEKDDREMAGCDFGIGWAEAAEDVEEDRD